MQAQQGVPKGEGGSADKKRKKEGKKSLLGLLAKIKCRKREREKERKEGNGAICLCLGPLPLTVVWLLEFSEPQFLHVEK